MEEETIEELLKNLDVATIYVDENMHILYANPCARKKLFHSNLGLFYGRDVKTFHSKHARGKIKHIYREARKGQFKDLPFIKILDEKKGTMLYIVKMAKMLDEIGRFRGFVLSFFDVTSNTVNHKTSRIEKIPVSRKGKIVFLSLDKILYVKAEKGFSTIMEIGGAKYITNISVKELESRLSEVGFFRVHRCCLVSLKYIKEIIKKDNKYFINLVAPGIPSIPISRRQYYKLKRIFPF